MIELPGDWHHPPREFSFAPFWFWNDRLNKEEIARQMVDFQVHGVDAFVIHPRVGLPRDMGWMSDALLGMMRFAIEEAQQRAMWVILYDEGMYPSGSSSGQVVAEDAAYQCRGMVRINLDAVAPNSIDQGVQIGTDGRPVLGEYQTLVAEVEHKGMRYAIVQRPIRSVIRGLHYINEDSDQPPEDEPPAIDLLNAEAVACFVRLVYQRFYDEFGEHFGKTIKAIFTDEPMLLGRPKERDIMPATPGILGYINDFLGYDFTPNLAALWDEDCPQTVFDDFERAIEHRLEQTYYAQLYDWCEAHNIDLTGHPSEADATRHLRYFHIPGQDVVWRWVLPDMPSALEGRQSTQGKAASSMMLHTGRRRNANEFCGAFGHEFTFNEMQWLANWLLVRGCNLLIPHAFYYSVRGPRLHERPPDVGPNSPWWEDGFKPLADACRRLSWLNTDSELVCHVAILGGHHHLPWRAAKDCFQHQIDFNYLDSDDLPRCKVLNGKLRIAEQIYSVLVIDGPVDESLWQQVGALGVPVVAWSDDAATSIAELRLHLPASDLPQVDASGLRVRHVRKAGRDWYVLFNEEQTPIDVPFAVDGAWLAHAETGDIQPYDGRLVLMGHERVLLVTAAGS